MTEKDLEFFNEVRNDVREYLHDNTEFTLEQTRRWFSEQSPLYYIAESDAKSIGYFRTSEYNQPLGTIFVGADLHKDHRGKKHAYPMYCLFLDFLREEMNINTFFLRVLKTNNRAISLYEKLGFSIVEEAERDFKMKL